MRDAITEISPLTQVANAKPPGKDTPAFVVALSGAQFLLVLPVNTGPLATGVVLRELGFSPLLLGVVGTIEALAFAGAMIFAGKMLRGWNLRNAALAGTLAVVVGSFATAASGGWLLPYATSRLVVGVGGGFAAAAGLMAVSRADRVDRVAALLSVIVSFMVVAATLAVSWATEEYGARGFFIGLAVLTAMTLPLTAAMPAMIALRADVQPAPALNALKAPVVLASALSLSGMLVVWNFAQPMGERLGLGTVEVGQILSVTTLAGIAGGVVAYVIGRPGRELALTAFGIMAFALTTCLLPLSNSPFAYLLSMLGLSFFFVLLQPFLTAITARLDPTGQLTASMNGWTALFNAAAPLVAGSIVQYFGLRPLALAPLITGALAMIFLAKLRRHPLLIGPNRST